FTADHARGNVFKPLAGALEARVVGPVRFSAPEPKALLLPGDSRADHRIVVSEDISKVTLPTTALTVEPWVWSARVQGRGATAGVIQHQRAYQKGWLLGFQGSQFIFAVASKGRKTLTYLKARSEYQTGCWYHVAGTYDGKEQCIYIDGVLQGTSR